MELTEKDSIVRKPTNSARLLSPKTLRAVLVGLGFLAIAGVAKAVPILDTASLPAGGSLSLGNFSTTDQDPLGQSFILGVCRI